MKINFEKFKYNDGGFRPVSRGKKDVLRIVDIDCKTLSQKYNSFPTERQQLV